MTILLKGVTVAATTVGLGGAGLVGSNYAFPKTENIDIEQAADKDWDSKLPLLATELKSNSNLAAKIDTTTSTSTLAFKTDPADSNEFSDNGKAKTALKAWCIKTDAQEPQLKDKLCKKKVKKGWLFGNNV